MVNDTPRPLCPRERDPVSIVQKGGWAPGPVWTGAESVAPTKIFFYIFLYSVLHPYLFLCLDCLSFCLLSLPATHNTNIHVPDRIRTRNPSRRAAVVLRLRPHGHWDRVGRCEPVIRSPVRGSNQPVASSIPTELSRPT